MAARRFNGKSLGEVVQRLAWALLFITFIAFVTLVALPDDWLARLWPRVLSESLVGSRIGAGEYLAFLIGVPVALLTSFVAIVIAAATRDSTDAQARIQRNGFFDNKLTKGASSFVKLVGAFDRLIDVDGILFEHYVQLKAQCESCGLSISEIVADPQYIEQNPALKEYIPNWQSKVAPEFEMIARQAEIIVENFIELSIDPFWGVAFDQQSHEETDWDAPLREGISLDRMTQRRLARITRRITHRLDDLAKTGDAISLGCNAFEVVHADGRRFPIAFIGALLEIGNADNDCFMLRPEEFERWRTSSDRQQRRMCNTGAAALVSMFNAVPDVSALLAAVDKIFPGLRDDQPSYFLALPDKTKVASDEMVEVADLLTSEPSRVVYSVEMGEGNIGAIPAEAAPVSEPRKSNSRRHPLRSARSSWLRMTMAPALPAKLKRSGSFAANQHDAFNAELV